MNADEWGESEWVRTTRRKVTAKFVNLIYQTMMSALPSLKGAKPATKRIEPNDKWFKFPFWNYYEFIKHSEEQLLTPHTKVCVCLLRKLWGWILFFTPNGDDDTVTILYTFFLQNSHRNYVAQCFIWMQNEDKVIFAFIWGDSKIKSYNHYYNCTKRRGHQESGGVEREC